MQRDGDGRRNSSNEGLHAVIDSSKSISLKQVLLYDTSAHEKQHSFIVLDKSQFLAELNILKSHTTKYFLGQRTLIVPFK